jgi:hypothetical protein
MVDCWIKQEKAAAANRRAGTFLDNLKVCLRGMFARYRTPPEAIRRLVEIVLKDETKA